MLKLLNFARAWDLFFTEQPYLALILAFVLLIGFSVIYSYLHTTIENWREKWNT